MGFWGFGGRTFVLMVFVDRTEIVTWQAPSFRVTNDVFCIWQMLFDDFATATASRAFDGTITLAESASEENVTVLPALRRMVGISSVSVARMTGAECAKHDRVVFG